MIKSLARIALILTLGLCCSRAWAQSTGDVKTSDYSSLNSAINDGMPSATGTLCVNNTALVDDDLTIDSHVTLKFVGNGKLEVAPDKRLTINGPIVAEPRMIFAGEGRIFFGDGRVIELVPQWWGAIGDGRHDDTAAIQNMVIAAQASGSLCRFPHGAYVITDTITIEATHGLQWRMPPGARIEAQQNGRKTPYAIYLKNCLKTDLEVNITVKHPNQGAILIHSDPERNAGLNRIKGELNGPGRAERKPLPGRGSIGLHLAKDGPTNYFNDIGSLRITHFDTCVRLDPGCNGNHFNNLELEKFWYGIELWSVENTFIGGFCHFAPGIDDDNIVDCIYVNGDSDTDGSRNQIIGMTCEPGRFARTLNVQQGGSNIFIVHDNTSQGNIIERGDSHILTKDRSFFAATEITDGLTLSTREGRGTPIRQHLSLTRPLEFPPPDRVPGASDLSFRVPGVELGDTVLFAPGKPVPSNCQITAWVNGPNTVKVRLVQFADRARSFDAGECRIDVWKH